MDKLTELYELAYDKDYAIFNYDLSALQTKGMIINVDGKYGIYLDHQNIENSAEETVVAAHEIGHAETGSLYTFNTDKYTIGKCEYRANKWAVKHLIPFEDYFKALNQGLVEKWQLAEHFNVTEDFIVKTHRVYQAEGLI